MSIHDHDASSKMGVKEFYKQSGRYEYADKMKRILESWIDPKTGLIKEEYTKKRNCPLCSSVSYRTAFIKKGFVYAICIDCGMMYVLNPLSDERVDQLYLESDYNDGWLAVLQSDTQKKFDRIKYEEGLILIEKYSRGKLLDVGSSIGFFLEIAKARGWDTVGIELNTQAVEIARKAGIKVYDKKLDSSLFVNEKFDAVSLWDTIEHVVDSREIFENIHRILKTNGVLLIETPNANSLAARILHDKCATFAGHAHVSLFSSETLTKYIESFGFEKISLDTFISEINVINNHLEYYDPYTGDSKNTKDVLGMISAEQLHRNLLGYKMLALFRKR